MSDLAEKKPVAMQCCERPSLVPLVHLNQYSCLSCGSLVSVFERLKRRVPRRLVLDWSGK